MRRLLGGDREIFGGRNFAQSCGVEQTGMNVLGLQHGVSFENGLPAGSIGKHVLPRGRRDTAPSDNRLGAHLAGFRGYAGEEFNGIHRRGQ